MAYPTVDAPYGLVPINLIGGTPYAGSTRQMKIASNYNTNIFNGDVVTRLADGTVAKEAGTATVATTGVIGVFVGCSYTDPNTNQKVFKQYYPASTVASDIQAYVVDDPNALFKVAVVSSGTTIAGTAYGSIGSNAALVQNAGDTQNGNSKVAINGIATTNSLPVRIVDVVEETTDASGNHTEVIVKFNVPYNNSGTMEGGHAYNVATGL